MRMSIRRAFTRSSRSSRPLQARLDARPGARAQPLESRGGLVRDVQACLSGWRRIDRRIVEDVRLNEGIRGLVVVGVVNLVGDGGDHPRLENVVEELVRRERMRR